MNQALVLAMAPLVVALLPAAVRLWRGRALARLIDDPVLPERIMSGRQPMSIVVGLAVGLLLAVWRGQAAWTLPILLLAFTAAGFPLRKRLYDETWSLAAYLWFMVRLSAAVWGLWALLAVAPVLTDHPGMSGEAVAGALLVILLAWGEWYGRVLRTVLRAVPVADPGLRLRFSELVEKTGLPMPDFDQVPLRGGVFANAVALPSLRGSAVVFSETLLTRFTAREVSGICAHELAHLEQYNPAKLRGLNLQGRSLVIAGTLLSPVLQLVAPNLTAAGQILFPMVLLAYLVYQGQRRQKNETAGDLRAVALTGDPDAMVTALEKLHAFARLPRRWDSQFEKSASHPSLAKRIRDIRAAAGSAPAALGEAAVFAGPAAGASVTMHDDHLVWNESALASHTLAYTLLSELRIEALGTAEARLVAVDHGGRRWAMVVAPADVARAQAVLDIVDTRLHSAPATRESPQIPRLIAMLAILCSMIAGQVAPAIVLALAVVDQAPPVVAAAGLASMAAAALVWRDGGEHLIGSGALWPGLVLLLSGLFLLAVAYRTRHTPTPTRSWRLVWGAALCGVVWMLPVVASTRDLIGLHQASRSFSGVTVFAFAVAAAVVFHPSRRVRAAALAAAVAGLTTGIAGLTPFLDSVVNDPFLTSSPAPVEVTLGEPRAELELRFSPSGVRLSPTARAVALIEDLDADRHRIHLGRPAGSLAIVNADEAWFIDDDTLIVTIGLRDGTTVMKLGVERPHEPLWERHVAGVVGAVLSMDDAATTWRLLGRDLEGHFVRVEGGVDGGPTRSERWKTPGDRRPGLALGWSGAQLLVASTHFPDSGFGVLSDWAMMFTPFRTETRLWTLGPGHDADLARSALSVDCEAQPIGDAGPVCTAFDGSRTHVAQVDVAARVVKPLFTVRGRFYAYSRGHGWLMGRLRSDLVALRLDTGELLKFDRTRDWMIGIVMASRDVVATVSEGGEPRIRIYSAP